MTKATYTEDNFEEYYRALVEKWCTDNNAEFRLNEWDGARENMGDDAFEWDAEGNDTGIVAYTDDDLISEYLYFCLNEDLDEYVNTLPMTLVGRMLAPDDQGDGKYAFHVYRDGDKPYSHYDVTRMDVYRGTYTRNGSSYTFTEPVKDESHG